MVIKVRAATINKAPGSLKVESCRRTSDEAAKRAHVSSTTVCPSTSRVCCVVALKMSTVIMPSQKGDGCDIAA